MDIILLILACFYVHKKAKRKGELPSRWVGNTIIAWILLEIIGFVFAFILLKSNLVMSALTGFFSAIGGFLLVNYQLDKRPDMDESGLEE